MSKTSESTARQNARIEAAEGSIAGIKTDVDAQAALIKQLQESPGEFTPEDQVAMDALEARTQALVERLQAVDAER